VCGECREDRGRPFERPQLGDTEPALARFLGLLTFGPVVGAFPAALELDLSAGLTALLAFPPRPTLCLAHASLHGSFSSSEFPQLLARKVSALVPLFVSRLVSVLCLLSWGGSGLTEGKLSRDGRRRRRQSGSPSRA
jgi:hypothetical protein